MKKFLPVVFIAFVVLSASCTNSIQSNQNENDSLRIETVAELYEVTPTEALHNLSDALKRSNPEMVKAKWTEVCVVFFSLLNSENQADLTSYATELCNFVENHAQALKDMDIDVIEIYEAATDALLMMKDEEKEVVGRETEKVKYDAKNVVNDAKEQLKENISKRLEATKENVREKEQEIVEKGKQKLDSVMSSTANKLLGN